MSSGASRDPLVDFIAQAEAWLASNAERRRLTTFTWGEGSDDVAVFQNLTFEEERAHIDAARNWQRTKQDAGYGSISWPVDLGGAGLPAEYEHAFRDLESGYDVPAMHEAVAITTELIAATIREVGTSEQRQRHVARMRRTDEMWCQLFSEPEAGSDLASLRTSATPHDDGWLVNGQKVWTSAAQYADYGYLLARTDDKVAKHRGITAFMVPMDFPGIEVRPLRQMSGGASFNEVFFTDVQIPRGCLLGEVGEGWRVALTTLGFEREAAARSSLNTSDLVGRLIALAKVVELNEDPGVRQQLARVHSASAVARWTSARAAARSATEGVPGPEGSLAKLQFSEELRHLADLPGRLLGPALGADTGEWGTFAWGELVVGAPGQRIAGGSDEVQRNIIGERILGLPREPLPAEQRS